MKNYRVGNWPQYNRNLKNRGSLTVLVSEDAIKSWKATDLEYVDFQQKGY